ncbi:MAG: DNA methyltransferase [Nitrospira sp.]|nr:DNA methyltransferase [Nitrospira sp.]
MNPRRKPKSEPVFAKNRLYYGDCLTVMRDFMKLGSVDLIYLDPPFNSNRSYNAIYKDETGRPLPDQLDAFCDLWELTPERNEALRRMPVLMREQGIDDQVVEFWRLWMNALRGTQPRLLAYMSYMVERLLYMKTILKPTGSLYLHCDPTASHYIKVMMDAIFGHQNFRNEIIWSYRRWPSPGRKYQTMHDVILFYAMGEHNTFHVGYEPVSESYAKRFKGKTQILDPETKTRKLTKDEPTKGLPQRDVWELSILAGSSRERLGYATQKPLTLLERIIQTSSNPGDVIFDPFCGCGTTLEAAHTLNRRWIGIDIAIHAVKRVARRRLEERCGLLEHRDFVIDGVPKTLEGAKDLWERDKYHFQKWAVEEIDGYVTVRRSADGGIDGRLYFVVTHERELQNMVIEVKGGKHVSLEQIRALRGVLDRDDAIMAGLIVMEEPNPTQLRNFRREFSSAGSLEVLGKAYPKMQMLTVTEILKGKRFLTPTVSGRKAAQPTLFG